MAGKKGLVRLGLPLLLTLCLSGCFFQSAEELYALPRTSETYLTLQSEIRTAKGEGEYAAPLTGSNTQPIQMVDLDGDGQQEALAFVRQPQSENPLSILIYAQNAEGDYVLRQRISAAASDIESVSYVDVSGDKKSELLVSWRVSASVHTLVVYAYGDGQKQVSELMRSGYNNYLAADWNGDGKAEVFLTQGETGQEQKVRGELYAYRENRMELLSSAPLSDGGKGTLALETGTLQGGARGIFFTQAWGEKQQITDVLAVRNDELKNLTLSQEKPYSESTLRPVGQVHICDIDRDGITELPLPQAIPSATAASADSTQLYRWWQYSPEGKPQLRCITCHNFIDGWYLTLPESWEGKIVLSQRENGKAGERESVFSYRSGAAEEIPQPFLSLFHLTGESRTDSAKNDERFVLWSGEEVTYAGQFWDSKWDSGVTAEDIIRAFHIIPQGSVAPTPVQVGNENRD